MASITIEIVDPAGSKRTRAEVPDDAPMYRLMPALASKMALPLKDEAGDFIQYQLHHNRTGNLLGRNDTIASSGAEPLDGFTLVPEIVPGGPTTDWWQRQTLAQPAAELLAEVDMSAPVYVPSRDSLAIGLVPADTVHRLEEYRSEERKWESVTSALFGASLGVIVNWVTSDPMVISRASIVALAILLIMAVLAFLAALDYRRRAEMMKSHILQYRKESTKVE